MPRPKAGREAAFLFASFPSGLRQIPVEDLLAAPADDARPAEDFGEGALDMRKPVRLAGQIRMAAQRHDLRPLGALGIAG